MMEKQGKAQDCEVSIVILAKNEAMNIGLCLDSIFAQDYEGEFEVLVIDSGSEDGTLEIVRGYPVTLVEIPPEEFRHGGTRNLGASLGQGKYIVYITADAFAKDAYWLRNLTAGLDRPEVAGVYGRQIPKEKAWPMERFMLGYLYSPEKRVQAWEEGEAVDMDLTWFSTVNSAIRRTVWERYPFSETIIMSEDQEWSRRVLLDGYKIWYEPQAAVYHSHNNTLRRAFQRYFDSGMSSEECYLPGAKGSLLAFMVRGLRYFGAEMRYLVERGYLAWIPYATLYEMLKFSGILLGRQHRYLPPAIKRRFSYYTR